MSLELAKSASELPALAGLYKRAANITKGVAEWAEEFGIPSITIRTRIERQGWDAERAVSTPRVSPQERGRLGGAKRAAAPRDQSGKFKALGVRVGKKAKAAAGRNSAR